MVQPADADLLRKVSTAQVDVENFAMINHIVPAERVRPHVPESFELESFSLDGREVTFITTSCFCNRDFHWSALPSLTHTFNQNTFRTYVTYQGRLGSYFFGTYVDTVASFVAQSVLAANSYRATFDVDVLGGATGYTNYTCHTRSQRGELTFELRAVEQPVARPPFSTSDEHRTYITHRLHGFARSPTGLQTYGPVEHRKMTPWAGELISGRFDLWADLGILSHDEVLPAYSVLVEPSVRFLLLPPRLVR